MGYYGRSRLLPDLRKLLPKTTGEINRNRTIYQRSLARSGMVSYTPDQIAHIKDDPRERITEAINALIDDPDVMFDMHCHLFNFKAVPDKFLGIRIPMTQQFFSFIENLLHKLLWYTDADPLSNIAYFINIGKSYTIAEIAAKLFDYYPAAKTIFCPLMMDMQPGMAGDQETPYREQIANLRRLREDYPDKLLPFVAIDPRNQDVDDIFLSAFNDENNFFGIKIYPSLGYLPSHPKLRQIFEVCQDKRIPVTTHCGGGTIHPSRCYIRQIEGQRLDENNQLEEICEDKWFFTRNSYAQYFNHPKRWEPVLYAFPQLKLNLAHFGSDTEWEKLANGENNTWVSRIMDMMTRYENLYADFSFNISNHRIFDIFKEKVEDNILIEKRALYGSDYYMVVTEGHFRSIKIDFITAMGDSVMRNIAFENPKRFLFA
jgi:predicted TIM-barrel fold metal-dependent hydrolase